MCNILRREIVIYAFVKNEFKTGLKISDETTYPSTHKERAKSLEWNLVRVGYEFLLQNAEVQSYILLRWMESPAHQGMAKPGAFSSIMSVKQTFELSVVNT